MNAELLLLGPCEAVAGFIYILQQSEPPTHGPCYSLVGLMVSLPTPIPIGVEWGDWPNGQSIYAQTHGVEWAKIYCEAHCLNFLSASLYFSKRGTY